MTVDQLITLLAVVTVAEMMVSTGPGVHAADGGRHWRGGWGARRARSASS